MTRVGASLNHKSAVDGAADSDSGATRRSAAPAHSLPVPRNPGATSGNLYGMRQPLTFESFPLRDQPLRFAAGDPSKLTSNAWRIWATPSGDVYIACRDNYRQLKVSLHASGSWQMGLTAESVRDQPELLLGGKSRHWEVWKRPDPHFGRATAAFRLVFLPTELALPESLRPYEKWKDVAFLYSEEPLLHVLNVWITDDEPALSHESSPTKTLAIYELPDGQAVQVTFHTEPATEEFMQEIATAHEAARGQLAAAPTDVPPGSRLLVFGRDEVQTRFLTELWWYRDSAGAPVIPHDVEDNGGEP